MKNLFSQGKFSSTGNSNIDGDLGDFDRAIFDVDINNRSLDVAER